jgi:4'-phosphopantetheinyl transferase
LLGHAALRALLTWQTGERLWEFTPDSTGKLRVSASGSGKTVEVSIAHSRDMIACAVSQAGPVGIDIEAHRPRNYAAIARYGFGPEERAMIARQGPAAFYRVWTLREAMGKATGEGLALATDGRDRVPARPDEGCWISQESPTQAWRLAHHFIGERYSLGIALPGHESPWQSDSIEWVDLVGMMGNSMPATPRG